MGQLAYRSLRAPRADRTALVEPPFGEVGDLVRGNVEIREHYSYDFQGRTLAELARTARQELLRDARRWTSAYRDVAAPSSASADLIFVAGHQPQLFHPGVWFKNFALGELARLHGAVAVNLVIDSDTAKGVVVRVPGGTAAHPEIEMIPLDRPGPAVPYEERPIIDRGLFGDFGRRAAERIRTLLPDPLVHEYWPLVLGRASHTDNLGACLAQARHQLEGRWGFETLEVPQSWVCSTRSFCWLVAHLLAQLPRFRNIHNEALAEYRRIHRIRSAAQPVPDLAADGPWLEAPLWLWTPENPQRRHLFARRRQREIVLSDRVGLEVGLPLRPDGDASAAVEKLMELGRRGVKIRSRALITTLWARLALGDLFLHGIGGAKYDQVTDLLIERFFGKSPPGFMVLSATLLLPIERPRVSTDDVRALRHQLRELDYHPEQYANHSQHDLGAEQHDLRAGPCRPRGKSDLGELLAAKARCIDTPQTPQNAGSRCRTIRQINQRLQPFVTEQRERLTALMTDASDALRAEAVLSWREYAFCLYPGKTCREFFAGALPKNA